MENSNAIIKALEQSYNRFIHKPQWLIFASETGELLGQFVRPNGKSVEPDRITALAAAAAGHHERRAMELELGTIQYGVSVGGQGFEVVVFLAGEWVLSLKFAETNKAILIDTLQNLPDAVDPVFQLSKK